MNNKIKTCNITNYITLLDKLIPEDDRLYNVSNKNEISNKLIT